MIEKLLFLLFLILISHLSKRYSILPNYAGDIHQKFFQEQKIPLIGGIFVLAIVVKIYPSENYLFYMIFFGIFFIGILSDAKLISSPKLRLILQLLIVSFFIYSYDIEVTPTRINTFDLILENKFLSIFFSIFCFMILVNGSNFIDGLNGLLIGYILIIILFSSHNNLFLFSGIDNQNKIFLIYALALVLIFNLSNSLYLGDSGAYTLGLFIGFFLVSIYKSNPTISPYYIILLLWYPCFEILFSMIRKFKFKKSLVSADNKHFHQLIYLSLKKRTNLSNKIMNNLSAFIINFYNVIIFYIASFNIYSSNYMVSLISLNIFIYTLCYLRLLKYIFKKSS